MNLLCLMHDSEEYGVLRWSKAELAKAMRVKVKIIDTLIRAGVLKGAESGECEPYIYVPRSGRVNGAPVTLIARQPGPIWYSSRMVRDEYVRANAGASTRFKQKEPLPPVDPNLTDRAKLRARVYAKTDGVCHHCDGPVGHDWHMDHLIPRSKGGPGSYENLVPSCARCNHDKSDTMPDEYVSPSRRHGERNGEWRGDGSTTQTANSNPSSGSVTTLSQGKGGEPW